VFVAYVVTDFGVGQITIGLSRSMDGGVSWTPMQDIAAAKPMPRRQVEPEPCGLPALTGDVRLLAFPQIAISSDPTASAGYVLHAV
jgi:hypothetical protein